MVLLAKCGSANGTIGCKRSDRDRKQRAAYEPPGMRRRPDVVLFLSTWTASSSGTYGTRAAASDTISRQPVSARQLDNIVRYLNSTYTEVQSSSTQLHNCMETSCFPTKVVPPYIELMDRSRHQSSVLGENYKMSPLFKYNFLQNCKRRFY